MHMKSKKAASLLLIPVFAMLAMFTPLLTGSGMSVNAANSDFEITDGVLTNYSGTGGAVTIPSGKVTAIADQAFYGCANITSLNVNHLRGIRSCFSYCDRTSYHEVQMVYEQICQV